MRAPYDCVCLNLFFNSTLLKSDQWRAESHHVENGVRGAINFRQIPDTNIYALGQPTIEAIDEVVRRVHKAHPNASKVVWITLREEPIVYINGAPYCLRRENYSLRNMKGTVDITPRLLALISGLCPIQIMEASQHHVWKSWKSACEMMSSPN